MNLLNETPALILFYYQISSPFFFKFEYPLKVLFVQYVLILVDFIIDDKVVFSILSIVFGLHVFLSNGYLSYEFCRCIS